MITGLLIIVLRGSGSFDCHPALFSPADYEQTRQRRRLLYRGAPGASRRRICGRL